MKINPVTCGSSIPKSNTFKGLYGKEVVGEVEDWKSYNMEVQGIRQNYYPFSNESQDEIEQVEKKYYETCPSTPAPEDGSFYRAVTYQLDVKPHLPFNKSEWEAYKLYSSLDEDKKRGLEKFSWLTNHK